MLKSIIVETEADPDLIDSDKFMSIISEMLSSARDPNIQQMLVS